MDLIFHESDNMLEDTKTDLEKRIQETLRPYAGGGIRVVTDRNVEEKVFPLWREAGLLADAPRLVLEPGEETKTPEGLVRIWKWLSETGTTRHSLLVAVGGGMVTDLAGFAAATFKRGIPAVYIPTTLLGAVDAAEGGKTGCNLGNLKNEVGAFASPISVIVTARPFATLPRPEILSGIGEMLKTGLIASPTLYRTLLSHGLQEGFSGDLAWLEPLAAQCIDIKKEVTLKDPKEAGLRKILNFGHTAGHAFESLLLGRKRPVPHGIAVAHGILVELILSHTEKGLPSALLYPFAELLRNEFGALDSACRDTPELLALMGRDKKNTVAGHPDFTLLTDIGAPVTDCTPAPAAITNALDIYRDLIGK